MSDITAALAVLIVTASPAYEWNSYGHMTVRNIADQKLFPQQIAGDRAIP
jgi:hypothetical protein